MPRLTQTLLIASAALYGLAQPAHAGGIGLVLNGGTHTYDTYYYTANGKQGIDQQTLGNYGGGIELVLGDVDNRVVGSIRGFLLRDLPPSDPDTGSTKNVTHPDYASLETRDVGAALMGIQWGLLGDPAGLIWTLNTSMGGGFLTADLTEFWLAEVSAGPVYNLPGTKLQALGNVAFTYRFRKSADFGPSVNAGLRYMFD